MANYAIPAFPTRRLRYYNNQFLKDQDFIDDQAHRLAQSQATLRALCVAGVCEGLAVRLDAAKKLLVAPGTAIDPAGRLIALDTETAGPVATALADGEYLLHIAFREDEDEMAPPVAGGAQSNTRWTQKPVIAATKKGTALPAGAIVLGTFTVAQAAVSGSSGVDRQYSGLRLPGSTAGPAATLANRGDGLPDAAQLTGDLIIRRDAAGALGPRLTLRNGVPFPGGVNAGGAIDFDSYQPGPNAPALRLQSLGDNAGSSHFAISTRQPGPLTNALVERLRVTSSGIVQWPPESPKDKLVLLENSAADRYGLGVNATNINVFCPPGGRFSLRQGSATGAEVFSVSGGGVGTFTGKLNVAGYGYTTAGLNVGSAEIGGPDPVQNGSTGGVLYLHHHNRIAHQLRYNAGTLWLEATAMGYNTSATPNLAVGGAVSWGTNYARTESRQDASLRGDAGARSGFYEALNPVNYPPGATDWWHLLDVRHSNPANNFALQIAGSFRDQRLWFRKTNDNPAGAWREVVSADAAGNVGVGANASVGGNLTVSGAGIYNRSGRAMLQANADDWLRVNPDSTFPAIALFKPVAIGTGGLCVGNWEQLAQGQLKATGGALLGQIGIGGGNWHAPVPFPYESIQLHPSHNLRILFGGRERMVLQNDGVLTVVLDGGRWVFQADGNLVKYNNANVAVWALNKVSGNAGW